MSEDIAVLKANRNQIAVRHGLPPVGAVMVNQHGIEWLVDGHIYLRTLASIARTGLVCDDRDDPQDLYPVILPQNVSSRLMAFIDETSRCTSKSILPVDTMPSLRPQSAHPEGYWVDGQSDPHLIVVYLDAAHVHETIFAHEIGHIWIDLVEDCEDYRMPKDLSNPARVHQWTNIQSFVLDRKVNEVLREKGFDVSVIDGHVEEALAALSLAILSGYRPPEPREAAFLANTLASAMLDHETGAADTLQSLDMAAMVFQRDLPGVYELACQLAASVRKHGYHNRASIRQAIDECALLSFRYIGEPLDLEHEIVEETPEECYDDKYPECFSGLPVRAKLEIGKAMARQRIPAGTEYRLSYTPGGSVQIQFAQASGVLTSPVMLHHAHHLPYDTAFANRSRSLPKGNAMMNKPTTQRTPVQPPTLPMFGNVSGRRTYAPGLAVFLSRVRLEEQLGGEHPYCIINKVVVLSALRTRTGSSRKSAQSIPWATAFASARLSRASREPTWVQYC